MASAAEDQARLLVSIEATQAKFAKQLAAISKQAGDTANGIERKFKQANDNAGSSFARAGQKVERSLGAQRAAVTNLSFQLNDITQGLLSGASPFTIMVQQGSQVAQALQGAGGGLIGAVKTFGGAFAQMVNPVSLASFAIIGLTGAAFKYFSSLGGETKDANELLKAHAELIRSFDAAFGIAEKGAKRYSDTLKAVELQKLKDDFGDLTKAAQDAGRALTHQATKGSIVPFFGESALTTSDFQGNIRALQAFQKALDLLNRDVPDFAGFAVAMGQIEKSNAPDRVQEVARNLRKTAEESIPLQQAIEATDGKLRAVSVSGEAVRKAFEALTSAALGWGKGGASAIDTVVTKVTGDLIPAMRTAAQQLADYLRHFSSLQDQINQTPLGVIPPVYSGGGQFLNEDQLHTFQASQQQLQEAGQSLAAQLIRGFENFKPKAYWDVDHYRAGFGSDTTTDAAGKFREVTKDTMVTLEDAQRDLSRRIIEFQDGIQNAIGIDTWKSLSEAQQAALTSIAYNYGQLPKSIVKAIQGGGGPEVVAQAIANLSANPNRRKQEAQTYLSGTGISLGDAGIGKTDSYARALQRTKDQTATLSAATGALQSGVDDYGYAVARAQKIQELLNAAQREGKIATADLSAATPDLRKEIEGAADAYAKAKSAGDAYKATQRDLISQQKDINVFGRDVFGGIVDGLREGKSAGEIFAGVLDKIASKLEDIALEALFPSSGIGGLFGGAAGRGGLLGGLLIPGILHSGGVAGRDGYGHGRAVSPSTFAGAKRYHKGGIAGLQPGEIPAILQRGEVVLPKGMKGGGSSDVVTVNLRDDSGRMADIADQQIKTRSGTIVQIAVQQSQKTTRSNMGAYMSEAQVRQI